MCNGLPESLQSLQSHRNVPALPPRNVTILRHCRCQDCEHWIGHPYNECDEGIVRNGVKPVPEYPPDAWHYCALYDGPQVSKDVFVWPKPATGAKERPAPGGGGPSGGPVWPEPVGEDRSSHSNHSQLIPLSQVPTAPGTPRAAQVGAGSKISPEAEPKAARTAE